MQLSTSRSTGGLPTKGLLSARSLTGLGLASGVTALSAIAGRSASPSSDHLKTRIWWRLQGKPSFTPPGSVFAIAWPVLWTMSTVSVWRVWNSKPSTQRNLTLAAWLGQSALSAAWSPLFFGAKRRKTALAVIIANLGLAGAYVALSAKHDKKAAAS